MFENLNPDLFKQGLFTAIRWASPFIIAYLTRKTGMASEEVSGGIEKTLVAINFLWALGNKWRAEVKLNTALDLPKTATKDTLKEIIRAGGGESALAKK